MATHVHDGYGAAIRHAVFAVCPRVAATVEWTTRPYFDSAEDEMGERWEFAMWLDVSHPGGGGWYLAWNQHRGWREAVRQEHDDDWHWTDAGWDALVLPAPSVLADWARVATTMRDGATPDAVVNQDVVEIDTELPAGTSLTPELARMVEAGHVREDVALRLAAYAVTAPAALG
ncbi:hypothetical protein [Embleya sp. NPDC059237]|uniref:hypothetical protein n=1 Tax=Embleya sp. NPDC059237 TaxID=3346784 RepID=UPI0036B69B10